jgi:rhodanese-related sulfurtransferase
VAADTLHAAVTAVPLGVAFGFILERAGLGDARVIRAQLLGTDFTVMLVMFGAIVTAMLGLMWGSALGAVDAGAVAMPPTDVGAQVVGAIVFGGGFAIAALCPGTACVAAASGRRDGIAAVTGVFAGTLLTPLAWPTVGLAAAAGPDERRVLPDDLGIPVWAVASAVVALAIAAGMVARLRRGAREGIPWWRPGTIEAVALTLAIAYAAVEGRPSATPASLAAVAGAIEREEDHVDVLELAQWIRDGRRDLRVIDVREGVDTGTYVIPRAEVVPLGAVASLAVGAGDLVVLYSDGGTHAAQAWVLLRLRGVRNVRVLRDGLAAWEDEVLSPVLPAASDDATRERARQTRELSLWFGGQPRVGDGAFERAARGGSTPRRRRRNTC